MKITSPRFQNKAMIPDLYTCDIGPRGAGTSPELIFSDVPDNAVSLVLTMHDPDVPRSLRDDGNWDHWLVWNIPPQTQVISDGEVPPGIQGITTSNTNAYVGPCPPDGEHRYIFRLYALDTELTLDPITAGRAELEKAMIGHILEKAELIGVYNKKANRN